MRLFVRVRSVVCYLEIFGVRVKNLEIISHLEVTWRLPQKPGVSRQNLETWQACNMYNFRFHCSTSSSSTMSAILKHIFLLHPEACSLAYTRLAQAQHTKFHWNQPTHSFKKGSMNVGGGGGVVFHSFYL